jgi:DNA-binding response OmpR family regulator
MASAKRILLVDGNDVLRASLAEQLAGPYEVVEAGSAAQAREQSCALAIIDQHLPDGEGESLARELRAQGKAASVLLLWEDGTPGSDAMLERLAKPFRLATLLARLSTLLGPAAAEGEPVKVGPYLFRPGAKLLTDGAKRKIRLTEKETNILKFLHEAAATVPRQTLLHEVWGYNPEVTTHTLETHIYRLRRKIEEDPGQAKILVTEDGGYRLA